MKIDRQVTEQGGWSAPCVGETSSPEKITIGWRVEQCAKTAWNGLPGAGFPASAAVPAEGRRPAVTLYELSLEYHQSAVVLKERITRLESLMAEEPDPREQLLLDARLRLLRSMWRETRAVASYLEHYYEREVS
jgi:hypothetical protein